jgi:energy-coupling factor transporter ATP-binding protein EcfA2
MRLGEILVGRGLVTLEGIGAATERQRTQGGRLGENLIALGLVTAEQLESVIHDTPITPRTIADTGIAHGNLLGLMLKFMHLEACEILPEITERLKLPQSLVQQLLDDAVQRQMVQALGSTTRGIVSYIRYSLSERGRTAALEALSQNLYLGPAPVTLVAYQEQILRQRITNEMLDAATLRSSFDGLVVPEHYLRKIGPAINAGRTVLLFGPPGNGKTTIATRVAALFKHVVYIPYAVEIDGQILKVFDPSLHKPAVTEDQATELSAKGGLQREGFDERWAACKRPIAIAGGELTLEMLDLQFGHETKFYEAPLHVKALNGVFVIDDFGRQQVSAESLLNRWIVPMESRVDYLKLNTGKSFMLPFDELLIFSTNLQPSDLMDPAFLRRIPYKIKLYEPTREEYRRIFEGVARSRGLEVTDEVFDFIVERLTVATKYGLAYYQPKFICEQVVEACKYEGIRPVFTRELAGEALANLYVEIENMRDTLQRQAAE